MDLVENSNNFEPFSDKYSLIYILFYALGVVTVVPSNFFPTANDYWMYKFRDVGSNESYKSENRTSLQAEFASDYNIVSTVSYIVFVIITVRFVRKYVTKMQRTIGCLCGAICFFILTCIFVRVDTDSWQRGFFTLTLIIGFFLNMFCGGFMVTLYETVVLFPPKYLPAIFSGQAICGIFAALAQIFALGLGGNPETTGLVYFLIGMFFISFSLIGFLTALQKSEFFAYFFAKKPDMKKIDFAKESMNEIKQIVISAVRKIKFYLISMVIALATTVMLQPGVISLVVSVDKGNGNNWNDTYFGPVVNFFFYNLFDYVGREAATVIKKPKNGIILLILSSFRIVFVPLILLCNARPRSHLPLVIDIDTIYILLLIVFAFSNGYLVNLSICQAPLETNDKERPFAMIIILLLMLLSLALSSAISTALVKAL